jgi:NAD(P)-dependent dehydrogenase (short-subunit alcohol dehydrogenase family)
VVADIDGAGADDVATELCGRGAAAMAAVVDVADTESTAALVADAERAFGPVDVFCANAGILVAGGTELPPATWDRSWAVNVMGQVNAARAVLPSMLERGEGYLVHTASAAGLLSQLGAAPYSVTKHAVVALAEWLSITHFDAGIRVSCVCPQGVRTAMTGAADDAQPGVAAATAGRDGMLEPEAVAAAVLEAVAEERFLVLPHPEVALYEQRRANDRERWLGAMRKVQREIAGLDPPS